MRLYAAATEKERVHFHLIHQPSGERVHTQTVVPGLGPVYRGEIVKGYEYEKSRYVRDSSARLAIASTPRFARSAHCSGAGNP
ncbi:MAG: Ku protein [Stellaceae bacterium]